MSTDKDLYNKVSDMDLTIKSMSSRLKGIEGKIDDMYQSHLDSAVASENLSKEFSDRLEGVLGGLMQPSDLSSNKEAVSSGDLTDLLDSLKDFRSKIKDVTADTSE